MTVRVLNPVENDVLVAVRTMVVVWTPADSARMPMAGVARGRSLFSRLTRARAVDLDTMVSVYVFTYPIRAFVLVMIFVPADWDSLASVSPLAIGKRKSEAESNSGFGEWTPPSHSERVELHSQAVSLYTTSREQHVTSSNITKSLIMDYLQVTEGVVGFPAAGSGVAQVTSSTPH